MLNRIGSSKKVTLESKVTKAPQEIPVDVTTVKKRKRRKKNKVKINAKEFNTNLARETSWLCKMFQDTNLTPQDKQKVLRLAMKSYHSK